MVIVCVVGAAVAGAGPQTARTVRAYGPGPQNLWTQDNNTFWDGNSGGDPNCYSSCVQWPYGPSGYFQGTWATNIGSPAWFVSDVQQAVADASALPFNSPSFSQRAWNGDCTSFNLCIVLANNSSDAGACAATILPSSGSITHAEIDVTTNPIFHDGPTTEGGQCDLRDTMHHEMGHVLGLGHSSSGESLCGSRTTTLRTSAPMSTTASR